MVKSGYGMKEGKSTFKVVEVRNQKGNIDKQMTKVAEEMRFVKRTHLKAASNALSMLCRYKKIKGTCVMFIKVKETTQGSPGKELTYKARRYKLAKPIDLGEGRLIKFTNEVKAIKGPVRTMRRGAKKADKTKKAKRA